MSSGSASVDRALEILDLLGHVAPQPLQLQDIAARLDLPESTVHRLLASLTDKHYVRQRESRGRYALGWKVVLLGRALETESYLIQELRPLLEDLSRVVKQTVNLAVLNGGKVLYLECLVPNDVVGLYTPPGSVFPAHATALGKALLAFLPAEERETELSRLQLHQLTPQTITSLPELRAGLQMVRERGYAIDREELKSGVTCLAAPVLDSRERPLAAISVTAQTAGLTGKEQAVVSRIVDVAREAGRHF